MPKAQLVREARMGIQVEQNDDYAHTDEWQSLHGWKQNGGRCHRLNAGRWPLSERESPE